MYQPPPGAPGTIAAQPRPPLQPPTSTSDSPLPGDRGERRTQTLVGVGFAVGFFLVELLYQIGVIVVVDVFAPSPDARLWFTFVVWTVICVIFVLAIIAWARTRTRRVVAAAVMIVLLAVYRLGELWRIRLDVSNELHTVPEWLLDAEMWIVNGAILACLILGWTIARRRTAMTWLGLVPAAVIAGVLMWSTFGLTYPDNEYVTAVVIAVRDTAMLVLPILLFWACDGIGMALRRSSARRHPPRQPLHYR
ncbi:hypothetical protein GCM10009624_09260 [Gordonia sinesedis]